MFIPIKLAGAALAGTILNPRNMRRFTAGKNKSFAGTTPKRFYMRKEGISVTNPLQVLVRGLSSTLSGIIQKPRKEDYNAVVKGFLPENAGILTPKYPAGTGEFQLADLDGDLQNELVASYRHDKKITTIILKKQGLNWNKVTELADTRHDEIHFRGFADITGEGKKQLLLGFREKEGLGELHTYTLLNGKISELPTHSYNRMEVLEPPKNKGAGAKAQLAIWNKRNAGAYDIEVKHWNGSQFEPVKNQSNYYNSRVIPYYVSKVKQASNDAARWYYLAEVLNNAGAYRDAITAIEAGISQRPGSPSREEFLSLKRKIIDKMK